MIGTQRPIGWTAVVPGPAVVGVVGTVGKTVDVGEVDDVVGAVVGEVVGTLVPG
jgi:hypothetical protein